MRFPIAQPFDLASSLESAQAFRWRRHADGWYSGTVGGAVFLLRQAPGGLESHCAPLPEAEAAAVLRRYFRLDDDLPAIYEDITRDPRVAAAVERWHGMRVLRLEPWEALVSFLTSIHSNVKRISGNIEAIATALGDQLTVEAPLGTCGGPALIAGPTPSRNVRATHASSLPGDDESQSASLPPPAPVTVARHTFPSPARVADAGEATLRRLGLGFRARFIAHTAHLVASGEVPLERIATLPYDEAKALLMGLPGVGDKVADCVLLLSGEKLDAFPIDRWVQRVLQEWYVGGLGFKRYADLRRWAVSYFGPYAGYAELYLFHHRRVAIGR